LKLYLLRHAKSSWDDLNLQDFKRPLSERGLKNSEMLNAFLKSKKISFDKVYSSSSVRTEITCSVGLEGIYNFERITFLDDLYHASAEYLEDFLKNKVSEGSVLVVGHNPGLSDVVSHLTHKDIYLRTCDLISIESEVNISKQLCNLCWYWSPKKGFIEN
jgi:phosphohistidine phosphatase